MVVEPGAGEERQKKRRSNGTTTEKDKCDDPFGKGGKRGDAFGGDDYLSKGGDSFGKGDGSFGKGGKGRDAFEKDKEG